MPALSIMLLSHRLFLCRAFFLTRYTPPSCPQDTEIFQLAIEDIVTEALENDNLQLQNLSGQKYVQTNPMFLEQVNGWQKKLGTVDSVLTTWMDVQKKWQALESIFIGSADIRVQLPEDSKRFDVINLDFQVRAASPFHAVTLL